MVLEKKTLNLLALLTTHAEGNSPMVPVVLQPLTPTLAQVATAEVVEKKRKRGKATEGSDEGEIHRLCNSPPSKSPKPQGLTKKKKGATTGTDKGTEGEQCPKPIIWNPAFVLSSGDLVTSDASLRDP